MVLTHGMLSAGEIRSLHGAGLNGLLRFRKTYGKKEDKHSDALMELRYDEGWIMKSSSSVSKVDTNSVSRSFMSSVLASYSTMSGFDAPSSAAASPDHRSRSCASRPASC